MTLLLGLPARDGTEDDLRTARRYARDLQFNPDRYLTASDDPEVAALVAEKAAAIAAPTETRRERVARFRHLRELNDRLAPRVEVRHEAALRTVSGIEADRRWNAVSQGREFALVLHSQARLRREFQNQLPEALAP
jgi:hypothetical protein